MSAFTPPPAGADLDETTLIELAAAHSLILVASSAGKDSMRMLARIAAAADAAGASDRVVVVHNDLGQTPAGRPVEWPRTSELAQAQAAFYGFPYLETQRAKGGLLQQLVSERHLWPSSNARWCTSDQKTSQTIKTVTSLSELYRAAHDLGPDEGPPLKVLYCVGLRAQESRSRARKHSVELDTAHSSSRRTITRCYPILYETEDLVWRLIHESGVPYHPAYRYGMSRLSCPMCILASPPDLVRAATLLPEVAEEYLAIEERLGHRFKLKLSMADIVAAARRGEAQFPPGVDPACWSEDLAAPFVFPRTGPRPRVGMRSASPTRTRRPPPPRRTRPGPATAAAAVPLAGRSEEHHATAEATTSARTGKITALPRGGRDALR